MKILKSWWDKTGNQKYVLAYNDKNIYLLEATDSWPISELHSLPETAIKEGCE